MGYFLLNRDEPEAHVFSSYQRDCKVNHDKSGYKSVEKYNIYRLVIRLFIHLTGLLWTNLPWVLLHLNQNKNIISCFNSGIKFKKWNIKYTHHSVRRFFDFSHCWAYISASKKMGILWTSSILHLHAYIWRLTPLRSLILKTCLSLVQ